ncbi:polyketide synthase [Lasiosphaeria miniovina]|uniref:Polyketide synthase n=1 Tax=Lasiosphaeria miniovina TaxID=1954250 RepID=A0AA40AMF0_9PEZI|nr:polyketide synthase [Lasiosphaeria miniovina]KAK0718470.1 polyketide synthase [Lasiosphaeria miniovina]
MASNSPSTVAPSPTPQSPEHQVARVLLFGDLSSTGFEDELRRLLHFKENPLLDSFFQKVGSALRTLIGSLPSQQQDLFPRFTTLVDLVSRLGETSGTSILRFFALSVHEVAQFIAYYGCDGRQYPSPEDTYVIGPCTGGFAAAAISSARTLPELIPIAVGAVLAAFRTALRSWTVASEISPSHKLLLTQSWSATVSPKGSDDPGLVEKLLNETRASEVHSRLYISATTPSHLTTLSGPPSVLHSFVTKTSDRLRSRFLDIQSPFHASHTFDDSDVEDIVGQISSDIAELSGAVIPLISSSRGEIVATSSFRETLRAVVRETLREPVRWEEVASTCRSLLVEGKAEKCSILPFSSYAASMLSTALTANTSIEVNIEPVTSLEPKPAGNTGKFEHSKIAIIGYSGRFPDAASNEAFWELLRAGRDVHREIPADRFDWKTHYDPTGKRKNTSRVKYGCFIEEPGVFDARFFNMSPREAENTDPAQRLAITTTYEALEMAGLVRNRTPSTQQDRIGVFFGTTSDDWREVNSGQNVDTYFIPGGNRAFVPGRISYFFRFSGPSLSIDTACSSSFAAIQMACSYLWRGECDTAVAGGTNVLTNPDNFAGLDRGHFLSTTGNCNAFDDGASGYCRADAVGSVILKRLEDAQADNDPIFGVIAGTNTNHCGQTDSITRPHEGDQSSVFKRIMRYANVDPLDISYVEMHGTGTQAGDATEMNSVLSVFVPEKKRTAAASPRPLFIGSAKANIGHAESSSGVTSLIKVLMMMKHSEIPPHCGIKTRINHNYPLDLAERGVNIAFEPTRWSRDGSVRGKRSVFLNNFSAAGGNTAVLLEDAPLPSEAVGLTPDLRPMHIVSITAKTPNSLSGNLKTLLSWLKQNQHISLSALSYTTTARRMHHNYRALLSGADIPSIVSSIEARLSQNQASIKPVPSAAKIPNLVFVFTGQGTLYAGIGKSLYATSPSFRANIERFQRIAQGQGFSSFLGLIDGSHPLNGANDAGAVVSQLALTSLQMALADLFRSWGVTPSGVIGHSLGEYAALYAAGVITSADAIYLVGTRAALLEKHCLPRTHAMLAVKAPADVVKRLLVEGGSKCELACANQPTGQVVSGRAEDIAEAERRATQQGLETIKLDLPYAFHSAQVEPILAEFEVLAAQNVVYGVPAVPILSPLLSRVVPAGETGSVDASYLVRACRQEVNFAGALEAARKDSLVNDRTVWLELGAHPICGGMIKGTLGSDSTTLTSLRKNTEPYQTLTASIASLYSAGFDLDWNEYHRDFPSAHQVVDLPRYAWDLKNYWIQYRNDFCLAKGEGLVPASAVPNLPLPLEAPAIPQYKFLSPSVQRVLEESHGADASTLLVESDIFHEKLLPVLQGHVVNGAQLCPSSLYADVALTIASYMLQGPGLSLSTTGLDVTDVKVDSPLIAQPTETTHLFRVSAKADWRRKSITMSLFSVNAAGKRTTSHVVLEVRVFPEQQWVKEWKRNTHLISSRIEALNQGINSGNSHKLKRGMVYKLFGALVDYSKEYQGMSEVVLDSEKLEAVSTVHFQIGEDGFDVNPRWIDSLGGIAGFIMNGNDAVESKKQVFINHGWERLRIAEKLDAAKTYTAYNRMQLVEKTLYAGDTYVLHEGTIVAIFEGVKFQGVPRHVLDRVLPPVGAASPPVSARPSPALAKPAPVPQVETRKTRSEKPLKSVEKRKPSAKPFDLVLAIICQEVGISVTELKPESEFADFGLDSLLSLTILARIREELQMDFHPAVFVDHPTLASFQVLVGCESSDSGDEATTPASRSRSRSTSSSEATQITIPTPRDESGSAKSTIMTLRQTIAEETGVAVADLTPSTCLSDIGVDSLLSLTMMARLDESLGDTVPRNLFVEYGTLQEVEDALLGSMGLEQSSALPPQSPMLEHKTLESLSNNHGDQLTRDIISLPPHASSVLLSGSPQAATAFLFLLPDGSGSASSYAALGFSIGRDIAVYGLNCPWLKTGEEMTRLGVDISGLAANYIVEIKRVLVLHKEKFGSRSMPFALGGWSAGGIIAVEAARQLRREGQNVDKLVLFDSPNPIGLQNPPQRMYDFFDSIGIFGGGRNKMPDWLRAHFSAFIHILDNYEATPLPDAPPTLIIYARDGVCKDPNGPKPEMHPNDPREMLWLLNNRTDFTADGWSSLLGRDRLTIKVLDDVNHFSLMDPGPVMKTFGTMVRDYLS